MKAVTSICVTLPICCGGLVWKILGILRRKNWRWDLFLDLLPTGHETCADLQAASQKCSAISHLWLGLFQQFLRKLCLYFALTYHSDVDVVQCCFISFNTSLSNKSVGGWGKKQRAQSYGHPHFGVASGGYIGVATDFWKSDDTLVRLDRICVLGTSGVALLPVIPLHWQLWLVPMIHRCFVKSAVWFWLTCFQKSTTQDLLGCCADQRRCLQIVCLTQGEFYNRDTMAWFFWFTETMTSDRHKRHIRCTRKTGQKCDTQRNFFRFYCLVFVE